MKQNINIGDEKLRDLLSGTRLKASDNLKYRIMQQIETEATLSKKISKNKRESVLGNFFSIYGVVYAIIFVLGVSLYFTGGKDSLLSGGFFATAILIISVGSAFLVITYFDTKRQFKKKRSK